MPFAPRVHTRIRALSTGQRLQLAAEEAAPSSFTSSIAGGNLAVKAKSGAPMTATDLRQGGKSGSMGDKKTILIVGATLALAFLVFRNYY